MLPEIVLILSYSYIRILVDLSEGLVTMAIMSLLRSVILLSQWRWLQLCICVLGTSYVVCEAKQTFHTYGAVFISHVIFLIPFGLFSLQLLVVICVCHLCLLDHCAPNNFYKTQWHRFSFKIWKVSLISSYFYSPICNNFPSEFIWIMLP